MRKTKKAERPETILDMNDNNIQMFVHCGLCLKELEEIRGLNKAQKVAKSPREYADLEVGFSVQGIQVWCKRHECNVFHMDLEGQKHPADTSRKAGRLN
jgi:hypothetical protein